LKLFSCFKGIENENQKIEDILKDVHLLEHQSKLSKELRQLKIISNLVVG
jgi:hypothetical protein